MRGAITPTPNLPACLLPTLTTDLPSLFHSEFTGTWHGTGLASSSPLKWNVHSSSFVSSSGLPSGPMMITHKPCSRRLLALFLASRSVFFSTVYVPVTQSSWMARTTYTIPHPPGLLLPGTYQLPRGTVGKVGNA